MRALHAAAALALGALILPAAAPPAAVVRGEHAYDRWCRTCHGGDGRGDGPSARWLDLPPRDLVRAEYRWRSTPSGSLPTDTDLRRTLDDGLFGTPMPGWRDRLPGRLRTDLVAFVKTLSERFADPDEYEPPIVIPRPPEPTEGSVEVGRDVYTRMQCGTCHGERGDGDGEAAGELKDSLGRPLPAYDFTKGYYKGGTSPQAIYRTYMTGLDGTPMPAYEHAVPKDERWPLVFYTLSLGREGGPLDWLFGPLEEQGP